VTSSRRPLVAGNWKLHLDHVEAVHLVTELAIRLRSLDVDGVDVAILPPFPDLRSVSSLLDAEHLSFVLGAQHVSEHDEGAFTGEVSGHMLARLGVRLVVVGHSERRRLYGMDDATVARTAVAVRRAGMAPIVCVGETGEERDAGATDDVLARQLGTVLDALSGIDADDLVVAYEPVWAIGSGTPATPQDAEAACAHLREVAKGSFAEGADRLRLLYGGSVDGESAGGLVGEPDVDGLLVGGASVKAASFAAVVGAVADCYRSSARAPRR
jgi:triosephosphate isomerase (TIM)